MDKRALVTGITGQDGSYLAELLLSLGYKVYGLKRRTSVVSTGRIKNLLDDVEMLDGDLLDSSSLIEAVRRCKPDEVYNLAAQSFVKTSFAQPELTGEVTGLGVTRLLAAVSKEAPYARFYQASSSEMFGAAPPPQNEKTDFHPRSPYGAAKMYAYWMTVNYRERDKNPLFCCNGILFNHESPRRGAEFVTQKIAQGVASIALGDSKVLKLGNLDAKRDWGHASDFVKAMHLMLQADKADDYVIATGEVHSVREFVDAAFSRAGMNYEDHIEIDPSLYRPTEVDCLMGDYSKAKNKLGWTPTVMFDELVNEMVDWAMSHPEEWSYKGYALK
jgi:GDPmannose 4,6-dehydratase